jgi:hypothetical protein
MITEFEKIQIVNVSNRNLVDHNMKGIEYAICFESRTSSPFGREEKREDLHGRGGQMSVTECGGRVCPCSTKRMLPTGT